jgi:hypothetical protein
MLESIHFLSISSLKAGILISTHRESTCITAQLFYWSRRFLTEVRKGRPLNPILSYNFGHYTQNISEPELCTWKRGTIDKGYRGQGESVRKVWGLSVCTIFWRSSLPTPSHGWLVNPHLYLLRSTILGGILLHLCSISLISTLILSPYVHLDLPSFPSGFPTKILTHSSYHLCMLHVPSISSSFIWSS